MSLSEGLRRFRKQYNLTQKKLATSIDIAEATYQRYEYGTNVPSVQVLINISRKYNVSIDYLVGNTNNPNISE